MSAQYIFLSHDLSESTPGFAGQPAFERKPASRIAEGRSSNSDTWTLSNHIGTHIDSPKHFSDAGVTLDSFSAESWVFNNIALVDLDAKPNELIGPGHLAHQIKGDTDLVLVRTGFEKLRNSESYWKENPGMAPELGVYLRKEFPLVRAIGFDFISLTSFGHREVGREAHRAFLDPKRPGNPILIIEDMKLDELGTCPTQVIVAPLRVQGADGAPVTVIAQL